MAPCRLGSIRRAACWLTKKAPNAVTSSVRATSAGVKGYPQSAPFAMGKFALRGLAQSMARELHPQGVHVVHVVVDGGIRSAARASPPDRPDSLLDPDAIAQTMLDVLAQPRSCWTDEIAVPPGGGVRRGRSRQPQSRCMERRRWQPPASKPPA